VLTALAAYALAGRRRVDIPCDAADERV